MLSIILASWELLTTRQKFATGGIGLLRMLANGLDLLALSLIGVLVGLATGASAELPIVDYIAGIFQEPIVALMVLAALIFVLKTVLGLLLSRLTYLFLARVETAVSMKIVESVFGAGLARLKKFAKSELEWVVLRSTRVAFTVVLGNAVVMLAEITLAATVMAVFILTDWLMAVAVIFYFSVILIGFHLFSRSRVISAGHDFTASTVSVGQALQDLAGAFREISVSAKRPFFIERIRESRQRVAFSEAKQSYVQAIPRLMIEIGLILGAMAVLAGEYIRTNGEPNFVVLGIFLIGSLRIMSSLLPIQRAFADLRFNQGLAAAAQKLLKDIATQPAPPTQRDVGMTTLRDNAPSIQIKDVSFKYEDSEDEAPVLDGISLDIDPGDFTAFIGPSGGGKSSLIDIILSLYPPTSGEVLIHGQPSALYYQSHPELVAYVPQRPGLVSGSIRDNVALGVPGHKVEDDRVWTALDHAQLGEVVRAMSNGIHSDLGKNTDSLSGGQMQRLGIARALYLKARLLVFDEATSALDAETESEITRILFDLRGRTTVIVVAHRLSTIKKADRIYVLDSGKQVASGTFSQLRKSSDLVKRYIRLMSLDD